MDHWNFFYADILGLYTDQYVQSSDYSQGDKYGGQFIWSDTIPTGTPAQHINWMVTHNSEQYATQMQEFENIFTIEDIRLFVSFYNKEEIRMLSYLMNWYNKFFKLYNPNNVYLDKFEGITDLRIK